MVDGFSGTDLLIGTVPNSRPQTAGGKGFTEQLPQGSGGTSVKFLRVLALLAAYATACGIGFIISCVLATMKSPFDPLTLAKLRAETAASALPVVVVPLSVAVLCLAIDWALRRKRPPQPQDSLIVTRLFWLAFWASFVSVVLFSWAGVDNVSIAAYSEHAAHVLAANWTPIVAAPVVGSVGLLIAALLLRRKERT